MAIKINNLEYDVPLEVRYWRHPAQLAEVYELKKGSIYTNEVYIEGSKTGDNFWGRRDCIFEWQVGKPTEV